MLVVRLAVGEMRPKLGLILPDDDDGDPGFAGVVVGVFVVLVAEEETSLRQLCITSTLANAINPIPNGITSPGSGSTRLVSQPICSFANAAYADVGTASSSEEERSIGGGVASAAACRIVRERRRKIGRWMSGGARAVASGWHLCFLTRADWTSAS